MLKHTHLYRTIVGAISASALFLSFIAQAADLPADKSTAVIFAYQRVGEDFVPQANISVEQFKEHIAELTKDGYAVLPVPKIIDVLKNGEALPPKTVGITFDGAYQTTLSTALPILEEAGLPVTVFFAPDMAEGGNPTHMNWDQIKRLRKNKLISFGILPAAYIHMTSQTKDQNFASINRSLSRYIDVLGENPPFFSYPYGEFNAALKKQLAGYPFKAAFGQQSGVVYAGSDFMALPRFTMTNDYGDLDRFRLTANALPLPVSDIVPEDTPLAQNPPIIGFTVTPDIENLARLSCFASSLGKLPLMRIGGTRVEIRPAQPFTDRRTRINCTLPDGHRWRWFGMLLIAPVLEEEAVLDAPENLITPDSQPENQ